MSTVYGESGPSFATIKRWSREFKHGRESLEEDPRSGRPNTAVTEENIEKVKKLVLEDRRIKLWQIAEAIGISKERIGDILHNHLHMTICGDNPDDVFSRIVTVDETWIRQYDPESKQESMQWIEKGEKPPRKFKVERSASKLIATVFWDCEGILFIDYLPKKTIMNGNYYAA